MKMKNKIFYIIIIGAIPLLSFINIKYIKTIKIPTQNVRLSIDLSDFTIQDEYTSPDSSNIQISAFREKDSVNLSIFIEKRSTAGDKIACRDFYWFKAYLSPIPKENIKKYERGDIAIVEHDTEKLNGFSLNFHSYNAYLASNNYWIDVHISKVGCTSIDKTNIEQIINSISLK